jgi:hypothetical protein
MGIILLYVLGAAVVVLGAILLFVSKSESAFSITVKSWIGMQSNSSGLTLIVVGLLSLITAIVLDNRNHANNTNSAKAKQEEVKPDEPTTESSNVNVSTIQSESDLQLTRSFRFITSNPTIKVRYIFHGIDTSYSIPEILTFEELKNRILRHFYSNEMVSGDHYEIYVEEKKVNPNWKLKGHLRENDRLTIEQIRVILKDS